MPCEPAKALCSVLYVLWYGRLPGNRSTMWLSAQPQSHVLNFADAASLKETLEAAFQAVISKLPPVIPRQHLSTGA